MQQQNNQRAGVVDQSRIRLFQVDEFDEKAIFLCQFCGGETCAHEDYSTNKKQPNAIEGLNSNWITDDILAMQRPSERLIKQFNIYEKFKEKKIKTVLNLQEPGEHPFCGDGIIPQIGFSYIPQNFFRHGIHCFNESWEDMTSTTFEHMMRIMNLFDMSLRDGGRISVHCHAGRGRTLLVICSWIIFNDRMPVEDVINLARQKRQGVLASSNQIDFLKHFHEQLHKRWISFGLKEKHKNFCEFVEWQTFALLRREQKRINFTSIVHFKIMRGLRHLITEDSMGVLQSFLTPTSIYFKNKWDESFETQLKSLKDEMNIIHFRSLKVVKDPRILTQLLLDFYDQFPSTLMTAISIDCISNIVKEEPELSKIYVLLRPSVVHCIGVEAIATILDFMHLFNDIIRSSGKNSEVTEAQVRQSKQMIEKENSKIENSISQALFTRLAVHLLSKKKYYPQLFVGNNQRQCKIYRYIHKIPKIVGNQVNFLTAFLTQLASEIPQDYAEVESLIFKMRKVDSNIFYLLKKGKHEESLSGENKDLIYQNSRINL